MRKINLYFTTQYRRQKYKKRGEKEMRIKKVTALLVTLSMCMAALAGCGTKQAAETAAPVEEATATESVAEEATPAETAETVTEETVETADSTTVGDPAKQAILVVSFGTSYNDSREKTIGAVEKAITDAFPDYEVRRAFTSQIIIDKLAERDGLEIDNVEQALQRLVDDGFGTLIVQPTHVMNGYEYDEMLAAVQPFESNFADVRYGKPLLTSMEDYVEVEEALMAEVPEAQEEGTAVVFMGHGTKHFANATYGAFDYRLKYDGYKNVFMTTVEGFPDFDAAIKGVGELGADKVVLYPFMIVAGDHANNDMAGDEEDSLKTAFKKEGYEVDCVIKGLGEYKGIQEMFVEHTRAAIEGDAEEEEAE